MTGHYDLAVIGAGAAGLSVTYAAARLGVRVALIERGTMGGECLNTGCIPSKTLLAAAHRGVSFDHAKARIKATISAIAPMDSAARYSDLGASIITGTARFTGRQSLEVDGVALTAKRIVVATGSRPNIPDFCHGIPYLTNETIWDLPALPTHLLILGGGPMAFEMAEAFSALGAKVTMIGGTRLLPREDPELAAPLIAALQSRGITLLTQRAVAASAGPGFGPVLLLADGSEVTGTHLLIAAGRIVDVSSLNLAAGGISAGLDGIATDRSLRCLGNKAVFAAGDAANPQGVGPQRYTHVAGSHASIIIKQALFRLPAKLSTTPPVRAIYTHPELAQVGATQAQAGPGAKTLIWPFADNDRTIAEDATAGLVKLVLDKSDRLVGAGITGPHAGEMIGLYALMLVQKTKLSALARVVLPYPTRSEAGKRAAGSLFAERLFTPQLSRLVKFMVRLP
ncbi:MAG: FAD-dependent oxidoreductase [Acidocella sp.]|nr:FAD-dependent oxidoreductase [Acidocella sp.]